MAKRYEQMIAIIARCKPRKIVEVGVHKGLRAQMMCETAMKYRDRVEYVGYDVFDTVDMDFHKEALNGKGAPSQGRAEERLKVSGAEFGFVVGDTRETLHGHPVKADFAFIDGDHRLEAIRGDAAAIDAPVIVFDDYYLPGERGEIPDLDAYGANRVVDEMKAAGSKVDILPIKDRCAHGGYSVLAVVYR